MPISYGPAIRYPTREQYPLHEPLQPGQLAGTSKVFWAILMERNVQDHAANTLLDVAMEAGSHGYTRIMWGYSRTDLARNEIIKCFRNGAKDPDDYLVMLDNDHLFPPDVIARLIKWNENVVGALAFRRGPPYFPCFFVREPKDGMTHIVLDWGGPGLVPCALVGTGAVAIKRKVFDALDEAGFTWPYFRYTYPPNNPVLPSEDIYFGNICEKAGIQHFVDTTFCIPHLSSALVDEQTWHQYVADHPQMMKDGTGWDRAMMGEHVVEDTTTVQKAPEREFVHV